MHNIDTLGATIDPGVLGLAIESGACLSFEVISRRIDDRGGGLAKVAGRLRLLEGLAQPREETEFALALLQHADDLGSHRRAARGVRDHTRRT